MTIADMKRTTSTLSPAPDMLQSPISAGSSAQESMAILARAEARLKHKPIIFRHLGNDKNAIEYARKKANETWSTVMSGPRLEQKLVDAALDKIQYRKVEGSHVSCHYPVFKNYVSPYAYGKSGRGDVERDRLIERHLDTLCGRLGRAYSEEEDDDEELPPSLKKQEGEGEQELMDVPDFVQTPKATPIELSLKDQGYPRKTQKSYHPSRTTRSTMQASSPVENDNGDESESNSNSDSDSDADSNADSEGAEQDNEDESDEEDVPMVAVSRSLPLLKDMPVPTKATLKPKHRFSTSTEGGLKAVSRGWVASNDDESIDVEWIWVEKKGLTPKKRVREDVEDGNPKSKKAKVETEA